MEVSNLIYCIIIGILAAFSIVTIYYSIIFALRNCRLLAASAGGSSDSNPPICVGFDLESATAKPIPMAQRKDMDRVGYLLEGSREGSEGGSAGREKCTACMSNFNDGEGIKPLPECIKEWVKLRSGCPLGRPKNTSMFAEQQKKKTAEYPADEGDGSSGAGGGWSFSAALFWWAVAGDSVL